MPYFIENHSVRPRSLVEDEDVVAERAKAHSATGETGTVFRLQHLRRVFQVAHNAGQALLLTDGAFALSALQYFLL